MRDTPDPHLSDRQSRDPPCSEGWNRRLQAIAVLLLLGGATILVLRHVSSETRAMLAGEGMLYMPDFQNGACDHAPPPARRATISRVAVIR